MTNNIEDNKLIEKETIEYVKAKDNSEEKKHYFLGIFFIIIIIALLLIWILEYKNFKEEREPKYCISTIIHEFEDGTVTECIGLGYKIYKYERISIPKSTDFGTIFMKMKEK